MHDVLNDLGKSIQNFLKKALPSCDTQWWENCVLSKLTFQQHRIVNEKGITSLDGLDLAGLLRVLDQNWREINSDKRLPFEARNWLKESQNIRNRWAHLPSDGLLPEDIYRDLDTVYRLLNVLGSDSSVIARVKEERNNALSHPNKDRKVAPNQNTQSTQSYADITKGAVVRLIARPEQTGAVVDILQGEGETRYQVFHDGVIATYYKSQIEISAPNLEYLKVSPNSLHAALTAMQLRHPSTNISIPYLHHALTSYPTNLGL